MSSYYGLSRSPRALCPDGTARVLPGAGRVRPQYCRAARPQALAFDRALPANAHKISAPRLWQSCVTRCQQRAIGVGMDGGSTSDSSYSGGGRSQQTAGEERHGSYTAGWESGWDAQLATHREWLLADAGSGQHGGNGTGQSSAAVGHAAGYTGSQPPAPGPGMASGGMSATAAALLPGHVAAAEVAAEAAAEVAVEAVGAGAAGAHTPASGAAAAVRRSAVKPKAPQYVPIVPLAQARAAAQPPVQARSPSSTSLAAGATNVSRAAAPLFEGTLAPTVAARLTDVRLREAVTALADAVSDAAASRSDAWTDEQVAALLQRAAHLAHRCPELRDPAAATAPSIAGAASGVGSSSSSSSSSTAADEAMRRQLRFRLQQLLLRLDGLLPGSGQAAGPSGRRGRRSRGMQQQRPQQLTTAAASAAAWAAATLRLRLSPDGAVHRRLLDAFKKRQQRGEHAGAQGNSDDHAGGSAVRIDGLVDVDVDGDARQAAPQTSTQMQPETAGGGSGRGVSGAVSTLELNRMAAGDLAQMLWALARLELRVPSVWLDGIVRVLLEAPACTREPLLPSLPSPHSLPDLTARGWQRVDSAGASVAAVSTGCAAAASTALGLQALPASELLRVACAVVQLSASATRGGAGSADAAGGGADQAAGGVTRKWAQALFSATQTRMREFSPDQLVGLLWAVGRGRREPNGAWRRSAAQALSIAAPQLAPWQLARVTVALAALRVALPYDLVVALLAALHDRLDAASAADVAGFVWGLRFVSVPYSRTLARMQMRPLLNLAAATQPQLQGLPAAQLVQLADGFAHMGLLPGAEWMRLHREACIRQKSQFSEANRRKVRQAYALMWTL